MKKELLQMLVESLGTNELKELRTTVNSRIIDLMFHEEKDDQIRYAKITTTRYISIDGTEYRAKGFLTDYLQEEKAKNSEITENIFCFIDPEEIPDGAMVMDFRKDD